MQKKYLINFYSYEKKVVNQIRNSRKVSQWVETAESLEMIAPESQGKIPE